MRTPIAATLALLSATACGTIDDFEVVVADEAVIDGTWDGNQGLAFGGNFMGLDLKTERTFADQGVDPGDVDAIFLKSAVMESVNPAGFRLDPIIGDVKLFVQAPGQARTQIAGASLDGSEEITQLDLQPMSTLNLKDFAVAGPLTMAGEITLKRQPTITYTVKTTMTLVVDINILGL